MKVVIGILLLSILLGVAQIMLGAVVQSSLRDNAAEAWLTRKNVTDRISQNPVRRHYPVIPRLDMNNSFGACLMLKEDNDLLYEWLAYHYTVLPLRYIFVGSDVGNQQDPADVLQRWELADTGLQYWVHNASWFRERHGIHNDNGNGDARSNAHHAFLHRQRGFITHCSEFMKKQGMHWVTFIDSDEFFVLNRLGDDDDKETDIEPIRFQSRQAIPHNPNATVLETIRRLAPIQPLGPCYTIPRLLYGALENVTCGEHAEAARELATANEFQYSQLSTLRFTQHSRKGEFASSRFAKVMVDLSNLTHETLQKRPRSIHRPFRPECGPAVVHFPNAAFYLNHYIGSWDRYSSRNDSRRNRKEWEKRAFLKAGNSCDKGVHSWFPRFIDKVGLDRARFLLGAESAEPLE